jgi:primosomal protein N'
MHLITVVPISRQKLPPTLTYFTGQDVPVGAVVTVTIRSKPVQAIVTETREAEDMKTEIRNAPFEIKKLSNVKATAFFAPAFIEACSTLADYYATTVGAIMSSIVPDVILENANKIAPPLPAQTSMLDHAPVQHETYAVQGDETDRMSAWRSLIRQQFARKKSLVIYAPTIEDVRQIYGLLEKGIEGYIYILHGSLTKKKILDTWKAIADNSHSVVIVATPSFSVVPRGDIESVVLERENGRGWMTMKSPYLDLRRVLEAVNRAQRRSVHLSDTLLRVDTLFRLEEHEVTAGNPFKWRSISTASDQLVSMKHDPAALGQARPDIGPGSGSEEDKRRFRVLSDELTDLIRTNQEESSSLFIMTSRRGLATLTVCDDCESIVSCDRCGTPLVLHASKQTGRNFYMCHACGERKTADIVCATCGGHRLSPLGIGAERVKQEVKALFPDLDVFQVDADTTTTEKQIAEAIARWREKPGSVLVGTETALHHIGGSGSVDHVVVASLDSLFALPDFRIEERLMYTLLRLRAAASRSILVQTRRPNEKVFEYGLKGNLSDFYRAVVGERRKFDYPPFSLLVKITLEGKKDQIARQMGELQAHLLPNEIEVFPAFTATDRGTSLIHGLIKIQNRDWIGGELAGKLRALPQEVSIKINPESLL